MKFNFKIFFIFLFFLTALIDTFVGITEYIHGGDPEYYKGNFLFQSPSILFRIVILSLSVFLIKNKKIFSYIIIFFTPLLVVELLSLMNLGNLGYFIKGLLNISKILFYPIVFYALLISVKGTKTFNYIVKITIYTSILISLTVLVNIFDIGFIYWNGVGSLGLMPYGVQNSLSTTLFSLFAVNLYLYKVFKQTIYLVLAFFVFLAAFSTGSKMALFAPLVLSFLYLWKYGNFTKKMIILSVISPIFIFSSLYVQDLSVYKRMNYHYKRDSLVGVLLGGREIKMLMVPSLTENYSPIDYLFGKGYEYENFYINSNNLFHKKFDNFEIDPIDLIYKYGFYGLIVSYFWWFTLLLKYKKNYILKYFVYLILFQSFLAGHVVFAGLSAIYIMLTLVIMVII